MSAELPKKRVDQPKSVTESGGGVFGSREQSLRQDNSFFKARFVEVKAIYQGAFAGAPWNETLSDAEVTRRIQDNMGKPGFTAFTSEKGGRIVGAVWYDTPSLDQLEAERRKPLRDFAADLQS
ncbi:MAG TPA: hypothetical protein VE090_03170 [Methylomirabilota bacterium]|nr:hypothetical protein [Methylomirabilota bacterium]